MVKINLPEGVESILNYLNEKGFAAYAVGGCIRDSIMGITPHDWDIATNATPDEVEQIFAQTIPTGKKYGTITVSYEDFAGDVSRYEVTTFRKDGNYSDGRRPDEVTFGESILEDLARRDFTINAMAYNPLSGLIDPFNGQQDIENKIIRAVGEPQERFKEDALRILRAIRFAARLKFNIDISTLIAITDTYNLLNNVSKERITSELLQILDNSNGCEKLFMDNIRVFHKLFDIDEYTSDVYIFDTRLSKMCKLEMPVPFKLYFLLNTVKVRSELEIWMRTQKFTNSIIKDVLTYSDISDYMKTKEVTQDVAIKTLYGLYSEKCVFDYLHIIIGVDEDRLQMLRQQPHRVTDLAITGWDISQILGICPPDKRVGNILNEILKEVIENPKLNTERKLKKLVKEKYGQADLCNGEQ